MMKLGALPSGASILVVLAKSSIEAAPSPPSVALPPAGPPGRGGFNFSSAHPFISPLKTRRIRIASLKIKFL